MDIKKINKPSKIIKTCESCLNRKSDFWNDINFNGLIRCYCLARHIDIDVELMSGMCDFYSFNKEFKKPEKNDTYGL